MTPDKGARTRTRRSDKAARAAGTRNAQAANAGLEMRIQAMLEQLRAHGMKLTPQRIALVRELASDPTHPTAQELFERLRPALPTMSFATVYNTLDALTSAGLCAALSLSPGPARFDPNMEAHHHAVCDRCAMVRDIRADAAPTKSPRAHEDTASERGAPFVPGFVVRSVEKIFRGLCTRCAGQKARRPKKGGAVSSLKL